MSKQFNLDTTRPRSATILAGLLLFVLVVACGVAAGGLAFLLARNGISPVVLFSLAVGASCGAAAAVCAGWLGIDNRRIVLLAAVLTALAAILTQHAMFYRQAVALREQDRQRFQPQDELQWQAQQEFLRPPTAWEFFTAVPTSGKLWWLADGMLTIAAALALAWMLCRRPAGEVHRPGTHEEIKP